MRTWQVLSYSCQYCSLLQGLGLMSVVFRGGGGIDFTGKGDLGIKANGNTKHQLLILILGLALCGQSLGMGLGEARLRSYLGQPLDLYIGIWLDQPDDITPDCFRLIGEAPNEKTSGLLPLQRATIEIATETEAVYLRIRTKKSLREPVVRLLIEANCVGGVHLVREYVLLLDPPVSDSLRASPPVASRPAPQRKEVAKAPAAKQQPAPTSNSQGQRPDSWFTRRGDTLWGIAQQLFPGEYRSQRRLIRAIVLENVEYFPGGDPNRMPAGVTLRIPGLSSPSKSMPGPISLRIDAPPVVSSNRLEAKSDKPDFELKLTRKVLASTELERKTRDIMLQVEGQYAAGDELNQRISSVESRMRQVQNEISALDQQIAQAAESLAGNDAKVVEPISSKPEQELRTTASIETVSASQGGYFAPIVVALAVVLLLLLAYFFYGRRARIKSDQSPLDLNIDELVVIKPIEVNASEVSIEPTDDYLVTELTDDARKLDIPIAKVDRGHPVARDKVISLLMDAETEVFFGRVTAAVKMLQGHIDSIQGFKQHAAVWLMLFRIYQQHGLRAEYMKLSKEFRELFNIQPPVWDKSEDWRTTDRWHGLESDFPRLMEAIVDAWGSDDCRDLLNKLLVDSRGGERAGFILPVAEDLLLLKGVLDVRDGNS